MKKKWLWWLFVCWWADHYRQGDDVHPYHWTCPRCGKGGTMIHDM